MDCVIIWVRIRLGRQLRSYWYIRNRIVLQLQLRLLRWVLSRIWWLLWWMWVKKLVPGMEIPPSRRPRRSLVWWLCPRTPRVKIFHCGLGGIPLSIIWRELCIHILHVIIPISHIIQKWKRVWRHTLISRLPRFLLCNKVGCFHIRVWCLQNGLYLRKWGAFLHVVIQLTQLTYVYFFKRAFSQQMILSTSGAEHT